MRKEKLKKEFKKTPVTFIFLIIMVIYFIIISLNGGTTNGQVLVQHGALFPPFVIVYKQYYRLVTSVFIHIGIMHLLFNGYALYIFGRQMERVMGHVKYLMFFLLVGIGANIVTLFLNVESISAGASGSLFGILGAFVYLIQHHRNIITPQGRKGIFKLLGINLIITLLVPNISITAHFGGFIIGYLLSYVFIPR